MFGSLGHPTDEPVVGKTGRVKEKGDWTNFGFISPQDGPLEGGVSGGGDTRVLPMERQELSRGLCLNSNPTPILAHITNT